MLEHSVDIIAALVANMDCELAAPQKTCAHQTVPRDKSSGGVRNDAKRDLVVPE
jgi:hypothetical protein